MIFTLYSKGATGVDRGLWRFSRDIVCRVSLAMAAVIISGKTVLAHPHVWVTMKEELTYATDGALTGVRHIWTFDEMFSSYAVQGIPPRVKGHFTRQELSALAQTNIESLKEYGYFTSARINGKKQHAIFGDPIDYWLDYDASKTQLTLHFTLPTKVPVRTENLVLEIYDPDFFVDFGLAETDAVKLVGAPANCAVATHKPEDQNFLPTQRSNNASEANAGMGASFANKITVQCR